MFSPLHNSGYSDDPTSVGASHSEKDVVFATETVGMVLDPDAESDINPGELTFEEGRSRNNSVRSRSPSDMPC